MKRSNRFHNGFTLLELLVVVSILGTLAMLGLPSLEDMVARAETDSSSKSLQSALSLAKSEAIKRGESVSVCASNDGSDCATGQWSTGWIVFVDSNADANGDAGSVDPGDTVVRNFSPAGEVILTSTVDLLQYDYRGMGLNNAVQDFKFCPRDNDSDKARGLEISITGRTRVYYDGLTCP